MHSSKQRIAIVDKDRCRPDKCNRECVRICPVNSSGKKCIVIKNITQSIEPKTHIEGGLKQLADIEESMCVGVGCGMCVRVCPFDAIKIINLPKETPTEMTFQYGLNSFRLYRMVNPKRGQILGVLGSNGVGKSTILKLLSGILKPNFGMYDIDAKIREIITYFRGSELQGYFQRLYSGELKPILKFQEIEYVQKTIPKGNTVLAWLKKRQTVSQEKFDEIINVLDLYRLANRPIDETLSGGELQRFVIADVAVRKSDAYLFDEASAYLDIVQRLKVCHLIQSLDADYKIAIEHDLVVLDYLVDYLNIIWGQAAAYGVVSQPISALDGINQYLDGFLRAENMRLRSESLNFKLSSDSLDEKPHLICEYPSFTFSAGDFRLGVEGGQIFNQEIVVLLGENGTGKSSLIKCLAGKLNKEKGEITSVAIETGLTVSYKPQIIEPKFVGTVLELFEKTLGNRFYHSQFQNDVVCPLEIKPLFQLKVQTLSGGERQRVGIVLALGRPADLYLLDEPSAFLDSDQRVAVCKAIKRFVMNTKRTAFIVEHDFMMATYLADRVIIYSGTPGIKTRADSPESTKSGINKFLKEIDVTFRHDGENGRPRINKKGSVKDTEQKKLGEYF